MRIEKMTKAELIQAIADADQKLNNPNWVTRNTKFLIGAVFVHRSKLREQLKNEY